MKDLGQKLQMKRIIVLIAIIAPALFTQAQDEIWIHPNRGQWDQNISYLIKIPGGNMFLEKGGFTYDLTNIGEMYEHSHDHDGHDHAEEKEEYEGHVVRTTFLNANVPVFEESDKADFYENYFLGNDPAKWNSMVYPCGTVDYINLYDGINLSIYENDASLKYDIIVAPGTDPSQFQVQYEGQDNLSIDDDGQLIIETSLGNIIEGTPVAFQKIDGIRKEN